MAKQVKFPRGYEVTIVTKSDILETLDANVVDKEIMKEIIDNLEKEATQFLQNEVWTGFPFLGSIKTSEVQQILKQEDMKELLQEAKDNLDEEKYLLFRKNLAGEIQSQLKTSKYYRYTTAINIHKYKKLYKYIRMFYGTTIARLIIFSISQLNVQNAETPTYAE